jgi:hypothetical protein
MSYMATTNTLCRMQTAKRVEPLDSKIDSIITLRIKLSSFSLHSLYTTQTFRKIDRLIYTCVSYRTVACQIVRRCGY